MGIREDLEDKYGENATVAEGLFFGDKHGTPTFRLQALNLGLEFSSGKHVGNGASGILYYNHEELNHLNHKGLTEASFSVDHITERNRHYDHVKLYAPSGNVLGEFLARDENHHGFHSGLGTQGKISGGWEKVLYSSDQATVTKSNSLFSVTAEHLRKRATFDCGTEGHLHKCEVQGVKGTLIVKNLETCHEAKVVRWTPDNLVFYRDANATVVDAYFTPEDAKVLHQLGTDNEKALEFNVTWVDI